VSRPWIVVLFLTGCASEGRLPASYFGEGSRVLDPGHVAITGAAGAGGTTDGAGVGGGGRVRVGIGGDQELGLEAAETVLDSPSMHCTVADCEPGENKRYTTKSQSALVSWKRQIRPSLALVAGVGMARHTWVDGDPDPVGDYHGESINGSLGLVQSRRVNDTLDLYMGVRLVGAAAIRQDPMVQSHDVIGLSSGFGGMLHVSKSVGLFGEVGPRGTVILSDGLTFGANAVVGLSLTM
jgi:hypothetical protein